MRAKASSSLVLALALLFTALHAYAANVPKLGAPCSKVSSTQIYKGTKYTCIKSGKKLVWNKGVPVAINQPALSPTPKPTPAPTASPTPTPTPSPTSSPKQESNNSYLTLTRNRGNSGWARALSTNSAVVLREDATSGSKSYRVRIISPQKDGVSFDSGLIQDYAENISFFVDGTICYVIYATEFVSYRDLQGEIIASNARIGEAPRAEFADCPTSVFRGVPIIPGPITIPKLGVQQIYSDVTNANSLNLRIKGAGFKSYQITLESSLNANVLKTLPIKDFTDGFIRETIENLSCDVRYAMRVKMWSENNGRGTLVTNVRAHSFTSLPCNSSSDNAVHETYEGSSCIQVGRQIIQLTGYLECRRISGDRNAWTFVDKNAQIERYSGNQEPIDLCKLKDARPPSEFHPISQSFPRPDRFQPATGVVDIALVGIDFKDAPGKGKPFDQEPNLQDSFDKWVNFWSAGKLKWRWHELNSWTRVPGLSTEYNQKASNSADEQMAKEVFTEINKMLPLEGVEIVLIYFPESLLGTNNGYMPYKAQKVNLPFGEYAPYYWGGDPSYDWRGPQNKSWYYYHEVLHGIGFSLHAPGNFFILTPTGVQFQNGKDTGYGSPAYVDSWSGFVNGWYDNTNIICLDRTSLIKSEVQLESIDINPKGQTSVMIKVSDKEMLVIESRRPGPFTNLPNGFAGVTVTKVDTGKVYARFDRSVDGYEWELNQWAYYVRVDQEKNPEWFITSETPSRIIGYQGETFTIDGIRIAVRKSGSFDSIVIERL